MERRELVDRRNLLALGERTIDDLPFDELGDLEEDRSTSSTRPSFLFWLLSQVTNQIRMRASSPIANAPSSAAP